MAENQNNGLKYAELNDTHCVHFIWMEFFEYVRVYFQGLIGCFKYLLLFRIGALQ